MCSQSKNIHAYLDMHTCLFPKKNCQIFCLNIDPSSTLYFVSICGFRSKFFPTFSSDAHFPSNCIHSRKPDWSACSICFGNWLFFFNILSENQLSKYNNLVWSGLEIGIKPLVVELYLSPVSGPTVQPTNSNYFLKHWIL